MMSCYDELAMMSSYDELRRELAMMSSYDQLAIFYSIFIH
jgi:hypothetical protein